MSGETPVDPGGGAGDVGEVIRFDIVAHGADAVVVHVVGEVDTLTAPALRAQLQAQVVAAEDTRRTRALRRKEGPPVIAF